MKLLALFILTLLLGSTNLQAAESDTYDFSWLDPDKEVYVLQNRKFRKDKTINFSLGYGFTTSGAFVDATSLQGRVSYFFMEEFGFEFLYAMNSGQENTTAKSLRNNGSGSGSIPFRRIVQNYMGGMGLWSPFYSKINTFNKIIYMDWILGLGFAKLEEENNKEEFVNGTPGSGSLTTESHTALMWNLGAKFYLTETWSARVDLTALHYSADEAKTTNPESIWYSNYDLAFSVNASF